VLLIDTAAMSADGYEFFQAANGAVIASFIQPA
jgi:RNA:NAD 2'-phosphotransferase (TPT1/KptA family)